MRRRRKQTNTWFPIIPTTFGESDQGFTWYEDFGTVEGSKEGGDLFQFQSTGAQDNSVFLQPLVPDGTSDPNTNPGSLRDYVEGQEWLCTRVVGKIWGGLNQAAESGVTRAILAVALAVLPVDDETGQVSLPSADINPLGATNASAPWLWRRTWTLYNNLSAAAPEATFTGPTNVANTGSGTFDAGHLDTKGVKRRIRREQRLFFVASAQVVGSTTGQDNANVMVGYDLRVLGAMRRAKNISTFK